MNRYQNDLVTKWTDLLKQRQRDNQVAQAMALAWLE